MRTHLCHAALAIALCAGATAAQAQTVTVREPVQIAPVEQTTVVRETVRERVIAPAPRQTTRKSVRRAASSRNAGVQRTTRNAAPRGQIVRETTTERVIARPAIETTGVATRVETSPLGLTPTLRSSVYRTIVAEPIRPTTVITRTAPIAAAPVMTTGPVASERVYVEPRATYVEPRATYVEPRGTYVEPRAAFVEPQATYVEPVTTTTVASRPVIRQTVVADPAIRIGARLPATVPVYALPASTLSLRPELGAYRYAMVDDQVVLIEPRSNVVVDVLSE